MESSTTIKITELKLWDKNPRSISEKDFERLKKQIQKLGQYKPLIVNQDNIVLGGNMRLRALLDLGINDVWVNRVETKDETEMIEYALSDNDRAGEYNEEQLAELATLHPIDLDLYHVDLGKATPLPDLVDKYGPEAEEDEPPEVDESNVVSKLGEIYQLGKHRVMCGDSTDKAQVEQLMNGTKVDMVFTDPPYGMDLDTDFSSMPGADGKWSGGKTYEKVIGDDVEFDPTPYLDLAKEIVMWGADYYADKLPKGGSWFCWDKRLTETADKGFGSTFELAWSKVPHKRDILRVKWFGIYGTEKQDIRSRVHPTQKPLEVCCYFIKKYAEKNDIILDLFLGSGSTLIACEQTDRTCYGMELDPKYVDVIRKRYAKFIGEEEKWEQVTPLADQPS